MSHPCRDHLQIARPAAQLATIHGLQLSRYPERVLSHMLMIELKMNTSTDPKLPVEKYFDILRVDVDSIDAIAATEGMSAGGRLEGLMHQIDRYRAMSREYRLEGKTGFAMFCFYTAEPPSMRLGCIGIPFEVTDEKMPWDRNWFENFKKSVQEGVTLC